MLMLQYLQVITIFSASNYYETGSNKGAYLKLVGPELRTHFVQFMSSTKSGPSNLTFRQRVGLIESSALRELMTKVLNSKNKLVQQFSTYDPQAKGNSYMSTRKSIKKVKLLKKCRFVSSASFTFYVGDVKKKLYIYVCSHDSNN